MVDVSIVLPVYNAEEYIEHCLDMITGQSLEDIEIICVDDGSKDNSLSIIKEYSRKDSRIKVIEEANAGGGAARNRG
ncbi:MAG: glycosyltransferase, partial [Clostridiales bacterium]|nr:glycosyltransferase [Clostridiales bacterium]